MQPPRRSGVRTHAIALVRMARPDHLLLVGVVFLTGVGMALARGAAWDATGVVLGLLAALVVSVSIHLANEYADQDTDALTTRTPFSGGSGATVGPEVSPAVLAQATVTAMGASVVAIVALAASGRTSSWLVVVLAAAAVLGWQYSLPPWSWSRRGWGEVHNAVLGGMLLPLAGVATLHPPTPATALSAIPFMLAVFANLLATQWPDRWADAAVGKFSLATTRRPAWLRRVHAGALVAALALPWLLPPTVLPRAVAWATLACLPLVAWAIATFTRDERPLPTVAAMVVLAVATGSAWWLLALGVVGRTGA